jgi:hypothetical protein
MSTFWLKIIINESLVFAQIFVSATTTASSPLQLALTNFISAGQALVAVL